MVNDTTDSRLLQLYHHLKQQGLVCKKMEFAKRLGVTSSKLSGLFAGNQVLTVRILNILAADFNVNMNWLLTGKGTMMNPIDEDWYAGEGNHGIELSPVGTDNGTVTCGWKILQILPTDRYYILFEENVGIDYAMADAVVMLSRKTANGVEMRSIGLNYSMANSLNEYTINKYGANRISNRLGMDTFNRMVRYKVSTYNLAYRRAILAIMSDFAWTKIQIEDDVSRLFSKYEKFRCK